MNANRNANGPWETFWCELGDWTIEPYEGSLRELNPDEIEAVFADGVIQRGRAVGPRGTRPSPARSG